MKRWTCLLATGLAGLFAGGCGGGDRIAPAQTAAPIVTNAAPSTPPSTQAIEPLPPPVDHASTAKPALADAAKSLPEPTSPSIDSKGTAADAVGVFLPDEGAPNGPALLGVSTEVRGKTYCAKSQLQLVDSEQLAIRTADNVVYIVDNAVSAFADIFRDRKQQIEVRATGTPTVKDGVLHLSAQEISVLR